MSDIERSEPGDPNTLICAGGYVLRQREWAEREEKCLYKTCPHPVTCVIKKRIVIAAEEL